MPRLRCKGPASVYSPKSVKNWKTECPYREIASVIGIRPLSNENQGDTPAVHGLTPPRAITDWEICGYERNYELRHTECAYYY